MCGKARVAGANLSVRSQRQVGRHKAWVGGVYTKKVSPRQGKNGAGTMGEGTGWGRYPQAGGGQGRRRQAVPACCPLPVLSPRQAVW